MDPVFALNILKEKYKEKQQNIIHGIRRTGKKLRQSSQRLRGWAMRKISIPEGYANVIRDMYRGTKTRVKTRLWKDGIL